MVKELVEVDLGAEIAHVKGTYWLTNTSDQAEHVKVGFPDVSGRKKKREQGMANLKVSVAGNEIAHEYNRTGRRDGHVLGWFVWEMDFAPGEEGILVVEYDTGFTNTDHPLYDDVFQYWLHTGADWKGRIKEATIKVVVSPEARNRIMLVRPHGASWENNTITWQFEDLSPTTHHDIVIRYGHSNGRYRTFFSINEIKTILEDPSHPEWRRARQAALNFGTRQMTSLLVRAAQRKKAFDQANAANKD
ncbi:MAG: hypothetical protein JW889_12115 [Verrucomicrobia bacterium]|nr:hypothetical protein [Verrucomicrobiota bacterium]